MRGNEIEQTRNGKNENDKCQLILNQVQKLYYGLIIWTITETHSLSHTHAQFLTVRAHRHRRRHTHMIYNRIHIVFVISYYGAKMSTQHQIERKRNKTGLCVMLSLLFYWIGYMYI